MHTHIELYKKVVPIAQLGIWERNLLTGEIYWNSVITDIYELEQIEPFALEMSLDLYLDKEAVKELIQKAMSSDLTQTGEFQIRSMKGTLKWVRSRVRAIHNDGQCIGIYGTLEDISKQVKMLRELEEKEERFRQAFDYAPIGMAIVSLTGQWIRANNSLYCLLGYEEEEFLRHTFQDFTHPDDLDIDLAYMQQLLDNTIPSYTMEKRYFHKAGHLIWAFLSVTLVRDNTGQPIYFISQIKDITASKKYTENLLRERLRLDNILKSTRIGTWEWDISLEQVTSNYRATAMLGYTLEEMGLVPMKTWSNLIHPEDRGTNKSQLQLCFSKQSKFYYAECRMLHKDGHWLWIEIRGKVIEWSADGAPLFMLGTYADINERKTIEQELRRTMEVITGQNGRLMNFAHIVSHNLRSHTGNFQMLLDLVIQETDEQEKNKMLQMLVVNANNLQETLAHLNEIVDIQANGGQNKKRLLLQEEIDRTLEVLSASLLQANAQVSLSVDKDMTIVYDQAYLESILLNLITNCIKYRHSERQLRIHIVAGIIEQLPVLKIQDNGIGIDLEKHGHKIFGMYKTFHGNDDARGIGLFLTKNQVEAMGGTIMVKSEMGIGTQFEIVLSNDLNG